jgi:release factor glutamine methyltransferase
VGFHYIKSTLFDVHLGMAETPQTLGITKELFNSELSHLLNDRELKTQFQMLCEQFCGLSPAMQVLEKNSLLSRPQVEQFSNAISLLKEQQPIQYILGEADFYGMKLKVNPAVLIPRPETEELVALIVANNKVQNPRILDIGTGSGCIPIALKKEMTSAEVWAVDVSESALTIAKDNALQLQTEIKFVQDDILNPQADYPKFDIIVSNPPYVPEKDKLEMEAHVLEHEPHLALFVEDSDPLLFYREIGLFAQKHLNAGGQLYFEIHRDYFEENKALAISQGFENVALIKDINENYRILSTVK